MTTSVEIYWHVAWSDDERGARVALAVGTGDRRRRDVLNKMQVFAIVAFSFQSSLSPRPKWRERHRGETPSSVPSSSAASSPAAGGASTDAPGLNKQSTKPSHVLSVCSRYESTHRSLGV